MDDPLLIHYKVKKIRLHKNGDAYTPPKMIPVSTKTYKNWDQLLHSFGIAVALGGAARVLYTKDGRRVSGINEVRDGETYVVSAGEAIKKVRYGTSIEQQAPTVSPSIKNRVTKVQAAPKTPAGMTIFLHHTHLQDSASSPVKLNQNNAATFQLLLRTFSEVLHNPVKRIYNAKTHKPIVNLDEIVSNMHIVSSSPLRTLPMHIQLYRNADPFSTALTVHAIFQNMNMLLKHISKHMPNLPTRPAALYTTEGEKITEIQQLEGGGKFVVVCDGEPFKKVDRFDLNAASIPELDEEDQERLVRRETRHGSRSGSHSPKRAMRLQPSSIKPILEEGTQRMVVQNAYPDSVPTTAMAIPVYQPSPPTSPPPAPAQVWGAKISFRKSVPPTTIAVTEPQGSIEDLETEELLNVPNDIHRAPLARAPSSVRIESFPNGAEIMSFDRTPSMDASNFETASSTPNKAIPTEQDDNALTLEDVYDENDFEASTTEQRQSTEQLEASDQPLEEDLAEPATVRSSDIQQIASHQEEPVELSVQEPIIEQRNLMTKESSSEHDSEIVTSDITNEREDIVPLTDSPTLPVKPTSRAHSRHQRNRSMRGIGDLALEETDPQPRPIENIPLHLLTGRSRVGSRQGLSRQGSAMSRNVMPEVLSDENLSAEKVEEDDKLAQQDLQAHIEVIQAKEETLSVSDDSPITDEIDDNTQSKAAELKVADEPTYDENFPIEDETEESVKPQKEFEVAEVKTEDKAEHIFRRVQEYTTAEQDMTSEVMDQEPVIDGARETMEAGELQAINSEVFQDSLTIEQAESAEIEHAQPETSLERAEEQDQTEQLSGSLTEVEQEKHDSDTVAERNTELAQRNESNETDERSPEAEVHQSNSAVANDTDVQERAEHDSAEKEKDPQEAESKPEKAGNATPGADTSELHDIVAEGTTSNDSPRDLSDVLAADKVEEIEANLDEHVELNKSRATTAHSEMIAQAEEPRTQAESKVSSNEAQDESENVFKEQQQKEQLGDENQEQQEEQNEQEEQKEEEDQEDQAIRVQQEDTEEAKQLKVQEKQEKTRGEQNEEDIVIADEQPVGDDEI